jgi:hypothetical protein
MVVLAALESLFLKPKPTHKTRSNNSTATNSTVATSTSAKIATPAPHDNNSAGATEEVVSPVVGPHTGVVDMGSVGGINVEDSVEEDLDVEGMEEGEDMVVREGDMGMVVVPVGREDMDLVGGREHQVMFLNRLMILRIMLVRAVNLLQRYLSRMYVLRGFGGRGLIGV